MSVSKNKVLGFHTGHDVSYCILENGIPIIHEELERFIRQKEPKGCGLKFAFDKIPDEIISDIKYFTHGNPRWAYSKDPINFNPLWEPTPTKENLKYIVGKLNKMQSSYRNEVLRPGPWRSKVPNFHLDDQVKSIITKNKGKFPIIGHHQSHAANAFFSSNFNEALIITIDGKGAEKKDHTNLKDFHEVPAFYTCFTIWRGKNNKIEPIVRIPLEELTLGSVWKKYAREIFNLPYGSPKGFAGGTVMAMASAGNPKYYDDFYNAFIKHKEKKIKNQITETYKKYKPIADENEQNRFDIAASLQKATEQIIYETIKPYINEYQPINICLAGGVTLNSVMMGKMYDWFESIENIFIPPVPYDGGLSIGSAQYVWHHVLGNPRVKWDTCPSPYLGVTYSKEEILKSLNDNNIKYKKTTEEEVLNLLDNQKIISLFHGKAESGKRALGNRSIIADPRNPNMKSLINEKVKHRQWFRPFAPSILREDVKDWFTKDIDSPYMNFVLPFKEEVKNKVPAVVHLDGTGRLQTVTEKNNKWYYNFIKKWKEKTNIPILLNTSFNDREPIVETPEHAIKCFMGTDIDYLYFSDYNLLVKKQ